VPFCLAIAEGRIVLGKEEGLTAAAFAPEALRRASPKLDGTYPERRREGAENAITKTRSRGEHTKKNTIFFVLFRDFVPSWLHLVVLCLLGDLRG
jgi:hypothetical protein